MLKLIHNMMNMLKLHFFLLANIKIFANTLCVGEGIEDRHFCIFSWESKMLLYL